MHLVDWLKRVMVSVGSEWVMWLMIGLSVGSVAIILERGWFYLSLRDDLGRLARDLQASLEQSIEAAQRRIAQSPSAEAAVVAAGLAVAHRGPAAAEEAMNGAAALQKIKLEKRLAFLATLGNNAPFIGLFGTVIGVVMAFDALGQQAKETAQTTAQLAPASVMSSISEALVATAVGIGVAIPAVAANNLFQRLTKSTLANTDALSRILLAHLKSTGPARLAPAGDVDEEEPAPAPKKKTEVKAEASKAKGNAAKSKSDDAKREAESTEESD
ncbi:MAG TPA: MotA/TolQ/ExbB proton channel family protein [Polyangiaceae bacterium]|jgi:biopolymer transport protein ExbB|nr:MotA/TolQ/ExbB proton channel family protein [Polyangiaceae bacterium]